MFYVEQGIALHAVQRNQASSRGKGEVSWFFSSCGGNLQYILELRLGWPCKRRVCSAMSGLLSSCEEHLGNLFETSQGNRQDSRGEVGDPGSLFSCHRYTGIPINFQEESGTVSF